VTKTAVCKQSIQIDGDRQEVEVSVTAGQAILLDETIAKASTDLEIALAFAFAKLKAVIIEAVDTALTIETNSGAAPDDTFVIPAGECLFWYDGCGATCPFTDDVTAIFVTEGNVAAGSLKGKLLIDPT
jgi:hypothetical protein